MGFLENNFSRRGALKTGVLSLGGLALPAFGMTAPEKDEKLAYHEMKAMRKIDDGQYQSLWENMAGTTDEELDWKIHSEANSIRWIIGH